MSKNNFNGNKITEECDYKVAKGELSEIYNGNMSEVIERLKKAVSIEELVREDGVELKQKGKELVGYHSNKHGSESKQSLHVDYERGLYCCFNCGEGGDVITWLQKNHNMDFIEAVEYLADRANVELPELDSHEKQKFAQMKKEKKKLYELYTKVAEVYSEQLNDQVIEIIYKLWGITEETLRTYKIGYAPNSDFSLREVLEQKGFDPTLIKKSGLLNKHGAEHFQGGIVFPYWKNGKVVFFIARRAESNAEHCDDAKYKKLIVHSDKNSFVSEALQNRYFIGEDSIKNADHLIITEGVTDCYAALQHGFACISPATVNFRKEDYSKLSSLAKQVKAVYICNDNETSKAGEKGAKSTAEFLQTTGIDARIIQLPSPINDDGDYKIDLAEYLRDYGKASFEELMKESATLLGLTFQELQTDHSNKDKREEVLSRVANLSNQVEFEEALKKLKDLTGVSIKAWRSEVEKKQKETGKDEEACNNIKQADVLISIAEANASLFHDEKGEGFAVIKVSEHNEIWSLSSSHFRQFLVHQYYIQTNYSHSKESVNQAIEVLKAKALFDCPEHKLSLRVARHEDTIYYDLANDQWQAVKITANGWQVVDNPPILFRRYQNTKTQVTPERGGSIELLKKYINLKNEEEWTLLDAIVATFFIPEIPHPVPIFYGDKGAAKTTAQQIIRAVIDPAIRDTMSMPSDKNELILMLMTNYTPCFDNLDGIKNWQSDTLCQAVTGGGISKRALYTDTDEVILNIHCCPIMNGINMVATRDDLLDRSILFRLERIKDDNFKELSLFWQEFEQDKPLILGAFFDVVAEAMKIYPDIELIKLPRMADFAKWAYAITEAAGGYGSQFIDAYDENRVVATEEAVEADNISSAILTFMGEQKSWEGTYSFLLAILQGKDYVDSKSKHFPKAPHALSRRVNKMKSALEDHGLKVESSKEGDKRMIKFTWI